jgi:hypothetical protein
MLYALKIALANKSAAEANRIAAYEKLVRTKVRGRDTASNISVQLMAALSKAQLRVGNRVGAIMLVGEAPSAGIFISGVDPKLADASSRSLEAARISSTINPRRADEKDNHYDTH